MEVHSSPCPPADQLPLLLKSNLLPVPEEKSLNVNSALIIFLAEGAKYQAREENPGMSYV